MTDDKIRVMLIDDHAMVRRGLRAFLTTYDEIDVVGEAERGAQGVALAAHLVPDVVLMDLLMPDMDGIETTRQLKAISPSTPNHYPQVNRTCMLHSASLVLSKLSEDVPHDVVGRTRTADRYLQRSALNAPPDPLGR
jgi:NarL family two-component system response regulator LiaR